MITELTAEQQARFPEIIEKWTKIGLCTDPADRTKAEEGVRLSYRIAGFKPPQEIAWSGSPFSFPLTSSPWGWPADSVKNSVSDAIMILVGSAIRSSVQDSPLRSVGGSVRDSVHRNVAAFVYESKGYYINHFWICGQHEASWFAYYDYFRVVCGLTGQTDQALGLMQVAENAGCWLPRQDICWISERPNRLRFDDRGRLHCEDGPALSYPDGWSIYAIHGLRVDKQVVIRPRFQSVDRIRNERDAEVKRIRIERFGWPEYLKAVGAVVVDTRDNDVEATKEALMGTPDGHVVLVCACPSTSRVYCLEVPPTITSCVEAQDWLSGGLSCRVINGA